MMPWGGADPGAPAVDRRVRRTVRSWQWTTTASACFGVVLLFAETEGFDLAHARQVFAHRVAALPRRGNDSSGLRSAVAVCSKGSPARALGGELVA
ncbi:hypothetical protein ACSHWB_36610 [Lentzea sp. HUAS TT2]|uniref:hypothetical protein n=1 Tax=Lentzea sp. HUAS TT2 TaxID=3447454 RepID=UPI003F6EBF33